MSDPQCRLFTVSGRVQGVFFRASTAREARKLGLVGHAVNLANGDVEVMACGSSAALDKLEDWLAHGPPAAKVIGVRAEQRAFETREGFVTG